MLEKKRIRFYCFPLFVMMFIGISGLGCNEGDSDPEPKCEERLFRCSENVAEVCTGEQWVVLEDCSENGGICAMENGEAVCSYTEQGPFEGQLIILNDGNDSIEVDLGLLDTTIYEGEDAIRLTRIIELGVLEEPWNNQYNIISSDGFDILNDKYEGDGGPLPHYGEMDHGYLVNTEEDGLRIYWSDEVNVPGAMRVKYMDGGTIQVVPIGEEELLVFVGDVRTRLNIGEITTEGVIDYKYPEDGEKPMVSLSSIFEQADVVEPEAFAYKFYGKDGFSNNDYNLMPYENTLHTWINPETRRITFAEEEWDTEECCWRIKDTILIKGIAVE